MLEVSAILKLWITIQWKHLEIIVTEKENINKRLNSK